ncbi:hypothetical protein H0X32_04300 [Patescibacteria group bacterium]|nr:hypothetical protein [Patescibacteria group bacterium]
MTRTVTTLPNPRPLNKTICGYRVPEDFFDRLEVEELVDRFTYNAVGILLAVWSAQWNSSTHTLSYSMMNGLARKLGLSLEETTNWIATFIQRGFLTSNTEEFWNEEVLQDALKLETKRNVLSSNRLGKSSTDLIIKSPVTVTVSSSLEESEKPLREPKKLEVNQRDLFFSKLKEELVPIDVDELIWMTHAEATALLKKYESPYFNALINEMAEYAKKLEANKTGSWWKKYTDHHLVFKTWAKRKAAEGVEVYQHDTEGFIFRRAN